MRSKQCPTHINFLRESIAGNWALCFAVNAPRRAGSNGLLPALRTAVARWSSGSPAILRDDPAPVGGRGELSLEPVDAGFEGLERSAG